MTSPTHTVKKQLRTWLKSISTPDEHPEEDKAFVHTIRNLISSEAETPQRRLHIAAFYPKSPEPNILSVLKDRRLDRYVTWYLPSITNQQLVFRAWSGERKTCSGRFGIPESTGARLEVEALTHVFVPGLSYGVDGSRLGRGGGYYDRFLSRLRRENPKAHAIGICRKETLFEGIPMEPHDIYVPALLVGGHYVNCSRANEPNYSSRHSAR